MSLDPVCGMQVADGAPFHAEHAGTVYRFCGAHCLNAFTTGPARYVGGDGTGASAPSRHSLVAADPAVGYPHHAGAGAARYTCPMHPEVVSRQPGGGYCVRVQTELWEARGILPGASVSAPPRGPQHR